MLDKLIEFQDTEGAPCFFDPAEVCGVYGAHHRRDDDSETYIMIRGGATGHSAHCVIGTPEETLARLKGES